MFSFIFWRSVVSWTRSPLVVNLFLIFWRKQDKRTWSTWKEQYNSDAAACSWTDPLIQSSRAETNRQRKLSKISAPWWQGHSHSAQDVGYLSQAVKQKVKTERGDYLRGDNSYTSVLQDVAQTVEKGGLYVFAQSSPDLFRAIESIITAHVVPGER